MANCVSEDVYFDDCYLTCLVAESVVYKFIAERGGWVHTDQLRPLYTDEAWLKQAIGPLRTFCANSASLVYMPHPLKEDHPLVMCVPFIKCTKVDSHTDCESEDEVEYRPRPCMKLNMRHKRTKRNDGKLFGRYMDNHLNAANALNERSENLEQPTSTRTDERHSTTHADQGENMFADCEPHVIHWLYRQ